MSDTSKPVWVWLPGEATPKCAGTFALNRATGAAPLGSFVYDPTYAETPGALALDPINMPLGTVLRRFRETRQGGLFGVIRDATPEGYGLELLAYTRQVRADDPMHALELSEGDTIGAIEVCDDLDAKLAYVPPDSSDLLSLLASLPDTRPASEAIRQVKGIHGTSAGGERPKLTVMHGGQYWLAKLQDRGDREHMPLREFVAMRVARRCGVTTADVEFKQVDGREVLLVRRFDRHVDVTGAVTRRLYASAHTVLGLDKQMRGDPHRSYVALARELMRWCARAGGANVRELQRELWRRIVLNSVLGNGDDHPRNTGLVHDGRQWTLSPAFDIAPYGIDFGGDHSMAISRARVTPSSGAIYNLLQACEDYGYAPDEAAAFIAHAREAAPAYWREEAASQGFSEKDLPFQEPTWLDRPAPPDDSRRARFSRKRKPQERPAEGKPLSESKPLNESGGSHDGSEAPPPSGQPA